MSEQPPEDARAARQDDPLLPEQTSDDTDAGWGERGHDDNDARLLEDRPPHWDRT